MNIAYKFRVYPNNEQRQLLVKTLDCVCIENLNMKAMSQILNFRKSVANNGWGM